jgi:phosphoglycerate dehydrogenase-like enzyme
VPSSDRRRSRGQLPSIVISADAGDVDRLFPANVLAPLREHGRVVHVGGDPSVLDREDKRSAEVLLTSWGTHEISAEMLDGFPSLEAIIHTGGSVKRLLTNDAWATGVRVSTQVERNAEAVAEYAAAMIVASLKGVFRLRRDYVREGAALDRGPRLDTLGITGKTVGLVGASRVGRAVARLIARHDLQVLVYDPYIDAVEADSLGARLTSLETLMHDSDVVSLHAPATAGTRGMITRRLLESMRPGATLINTARGSVVDQDALIDVLRTGDLFAILDVTEPMVPAADSALWGLENVFLTPHIAGATGSDLQRLGRGAVDEAIRVLTGEELAHRVRAEDLSRIA